MHSVNTNTETSQKLPNNTDRKYYVQTLASEIMLNGSREQNVN